MLEKPKKTAENLPVDGDAENEPADQEVLTRRVVNDELRRKVHVGQSQAASIRSARHKGAE